jgi:surfactin synthase thioesterase subunit
MDPTKAIVSLLKTGGGGVTNKLFCFHWSGGNGNSFRHWATAFRDTPDTSFELYGVTWRRLKGFFYESIAEIAKGK